MRRAGHVRGTPGGGAAALQWAWLAPCVCAIASRIAGNSMPSRLLRPCTKSRGKARAGSAHRLHQHGRHAVDVVAIVQSHACTQPPRSLSSPWDRYNAAAGTAVALALRLLDGHPDSSELPFAAHSVRILLKHLKFLLLQDACAPAQRPTARPACNASTLREQAGPPTKRASGRALPRMRLRCVPLCFIFTCCCATVMLSWWCPCRGTSPPSAHRPRSLVMCVKMMIVYSSMQYLQLEQRPMTHSRMESAP